MGDQAAFPISLELQRVKQYCEIMILERIPEIQKLSPSEKLMLVEELWDELADDPAAHPVVPEHIEELDRRMEEYRKNPNSILRWDEIRARILAK